MAVSVLELSVSEGAGAGLYEVQVVRSSAGECSGTMRLDAAAVLDRRDQLQQALIASSADTRRLLPTSEAEVRSTGLELFDALLGQPAVLSCYRASAALAQERGDPLRIVLRLNTPELAALPWECMYDPGTGSYLCRGEPLVRHVPVARPLAPLPISGPLHILAVAASPRGLPTLDVDREKEILESALSGPVGRGAIELVWTKEATWPRLQDLLLSDEWHVVHFVGHGDFDVERDEGVLALVREDGRVNAIGAARFVDLLREARPMPRLVVLNSCVSGATGKHDLFSGTAAALVRGGVSAVAAMQFTVTDSAAIAFARGFYVSIAAGRPVDDALRSGRVAILGLSEQTLEWVTPVLYLRGTDAHLFTMARRGKGTAKPEPSAGPPPGGAARTSEVVAPPSKRSAAPSAVPVEGDPVPASEVTGKNYASASPAPPGKSRRTTTEQPKTRALRPGKAVAARTPSRISRPVRREAAAGNSSVEQIVLATLRTVEPSDRLYIAPGIPSAKLEKAGRGVGLPDGEGVLALVDCSYFEAAKMCLLFTQMGLRHRDYGGVHKLAYAEFFGRRFNVSSRKYSLYVDDVSWLITASVSKDLLLALHGVLLSLQRKFETEGLRQGNR